MGNTYTINKYVTVYGWTPEGRPFQFRVQFASGEMLVSLSYRIEARSGIMPHSQCLLNCGRPLYGLHTTIEQNHIQSGDQLLLSIREGWSGTFDPDIHLSDKQKIEKQREMEISKKNQDLERQDQLQVLRDLISCQETNYKTAYKTGDLILNSRKDKDQKNQKNQMKQPKEQPRPPQNQPAPPAQQAVDSSSSSVSSSSSSFNSNSNSTLEGGLELVLLN